MTDAPVWFSSDRQIEALSSAFGSASLLARMMGRYDFPADVAHLRGIFAPWMRIPLVLRAQGSLVIDPGAMTFRAEPFKTFGWTPGGLLEGLSFELQPSEVSSVTAEDFKSPVMRGFDLSFSRVRTTRPAPIDNFLLCVGGRIAMPLIRARSRELRESLLAWKADGLGASHGAS